MESGLLQRRTGNMNLVPHIGTKNHWTILKKLLMPREIPPSVPDRRGDGSGQMQEVESCGRSASAAVRPSYSNP